MTPIVQVPPLAAIDWQPLLWILKSPLFVPAIVAPLTVTAIFITWDDWGGWFDHVAPPQVLVNCTQWGCGYVYGFRVPLIVVSPYVKAQYISHAQHDFGSILKFIESTFSLPSLGYAHSMADDFSDCFDFNQTPLQFQTIPSAWDAQYFLNDKTPPTAPDSD